MSESDSQNHARKGITLALIAMETSGRDLGSETLLLRPRRSNTTVAAFTQENGSHKSNVPPETAPGRVLRMSKANRGSVNGGNGGISPVKSILFQFIATVSRRGMVESPPNVPSETADGRTAGTTT